MPLQVIDKLNAIICTGCPSPNVLTVTMNQTVFCSGQLCATIKDRVPALNILPFPACAFNAATGTCIPAIPADWTPGSPTTSHQKIPALRQSDTLQCAVGGTISIQFAGQAQVDVD
jgi:hypothetical protein